MADTYTLREAVAEDMRYLRPMHGQSWLATYPSEEAGVSYEWVKLRTDKWREPEMMAQSIEILKNILNSPDHFYRLAETKDEIVGLVHVKVNEDLTKELEAIYTLPATFGTGLGQQLMDAALEYIGSTPTTLKVANYNNRAIRFYEKNGFKKVEGSEELYAETIPMITMKREGAL